MISNHYAMTYGHPYGWLILIGMLLAGALIRVYFVARHKGNASLLPMAVAILILLGMAAAIAPRAPPQTTTSSGALPTTFADVITIIQERCTTCHGAQPTFAGFPAAPGGVAFDTPDQIAKEALRIHQQVVLTRIMPIGNLTQMEDEERAVIDQWYRDGGAIDWVAQH